MSLLKSVVSQLLVRAEETTIKSSADKDANEQGVLSTVYLFVGEVLSRISQRGSTGEISSLRMQVHVYC
jgi:telomere length regulation protein